MFLRCVTLLRRRSGEKDLFGLVQCLPCLEIVTCLLMRDLIVIWGYKVISNLSCFLSYQNIFTDSKDVFCNFHNFTDCGVVV